MIQGKLVVLRSVEERDLPLLAKWRNAPENRRFFFSPYPVNPGGQKKWYEGLLADRSRLMLMVDNRAGEPVGVIGLDHIDWRNQEAEFGQIMLDPAQRGSGCAEEAALLLIAFAFDELNLHRLFAVVYDYNRGVVAGLKAAGFQVEGVLRQAAFSQGKFHDKVVLGLLREEWERELLDATAG